MDGGGRLSGSLNAAGSPVGAGRPALFRRRGRRHLAAQPIEKRVPRGLGTALVTSTLAVFALTGFVASGRYDAFVAEQGRPLDVLARLLGFGIERVTISGISRMYEHEVLHAAGIDWRASVPFFDLDLARERLLAEPLIASVSIRKLYPNEIVVNQVEREPAALWQKDGAISVIAADGTVIDQIHDDRYNTLPLVVGEDANVHLQDYLALIESAGPLGDRIKAGTFVSGRRWTLKLDGVDIRLPEKEAAQALARLVAVERSSRVLEKDIIAVDLRLPDRLVVRLTEEAAAARAEAQKKKSKPGSQT